MALEHLKEAAKGSMKKIGDCAVFMGICSDNYADDPVCLMQLALALLLDKPIFLLFQQGVVIPKNLIRCLEGYEYYEHDNESSFKQASEKLSDKIRQYIDIED